VSKLSQNSSSALGLCPNSGRVRCPAVEPLQRLAHHVQFGVAFPADADCVREGVLQEDLVSRILRATGLKPNDGVRFRDIKGDDPAIEAEAAASELIARRKRPGCGDRDYRADPGLPPQIPARSDY